MAKKTSGINNPRRIFWITVVVLVFVGVGISLSAAFLSEDVNENESAAAVETNLGDGDPGASADNTSGGNGKTIEVENQSEMITVVPNKREGVIGNPGIGWIYRWGDGELPMIPSTVAYAERSDISWRILNPAEGVYDWQALDAALQAAITQGKQLSFRVYTMRGESYGGHQLPAWVLDKGAVLMPSGEPDYSNCIYQEEWGRFVDALASRYDGNANIAFIDISGYGNFNEWSWRDDQTVWDDLWESNYEDGIANPANFLSLDGQARRRLADMFIGGDFSGHTCRGDNGQSQLVNYSYEGFVSTQLVMPYAGTAQSTQYVFTQRPDVGFRYDCLGRSSSLDILEKFESELPQIWENAPIVFETCGKDDFNLSAAEAMFSRARGSLIYNVNIPWLSEGEIANLMGNAGYKYYLAKAIYSSQASPGGEFYIGMKWQNIGSAPSYPKMGQDFGLFVVLENSSDQERVNYLVNEDISKWYPTEDPDTWVERALKLDEGITPGEYIVMVGILDNRTGDWINLGVEDSEADGLYSVGGITILQP